MCGLYDADNESADNETTPSWSIQTSTSETAIGDDFKETLMPNDPNLVDLFLVYKSFAVKLKMTIKFKMKVQLKMTLKFKIYKYHL